MVDRIDARVVSEPFFSEDVQGPKTILGDGPARRAIAIDLDAGRIFNRPNSGSGVLTKFARRQRINRSMPVTVAGRLLAARGSLPKQFSQMRRPPAHT